MAQYYRVKERVKHLQNFDKKTLHYGYFFGFNNFGYDIKYVENYAVPSSSRIPDGQNLPNIELVKNTGFNVGLIGDLRINEYFNLRIEPGLYYNQRDLMYPSNTPRMSSEADYLREVKSTYIHLPLLIKFSGERINNWKPYLVGGVSTSFNLSSNAKNNDDNFNNVFRVNSQMFSYEVGFGIDFYLVYFKFSPSIRGIFSIQNELIKDNPSNGISPWTSNITSLMSQGIAINLTFE
ncbi:MAG: porin family protein [Flavobacteriaceae bacterium]